MKWICGRRATGVFQFQSKFGCLGLPIHLNGLKGLSSKTKATRTPPASSPAGMTLASSLTVGLLVIMVAANTASAVYFDVTAITADRFSLVNFVCISLNGTVISANPRGSFSSPIQLGTTSVASFIVESFLLSQNECQAAVLSHSDSLLIPPYCPTSLGYPTLTCAPGTIAVVDCPDGSTVWAWIDENEWALVAPVTDGILISLSHIYPLSPDGKGSDVSGMYVWGAIGLQDAAALSEDGCQCNQAECGQQAFGKFECGVSSGCGSTVAPTPTPSTSTVVVVQQPSFGPTINQLTEGATSMPRSSAPTVAPVGNSGMPQGGMTAHCVSMVLVALSLATTW